MSKTSGQNLPKITYQKADTVPVHDVVVVSTNTESPSQRTATTTHTEKPVLMRYPPRAPRRSADDTRTD